MTFEKKMDNNNCYSYIYNKNTLIGKNTGRLIHFCHLKYESLFFFQKELITNKQLQKPILVLDQKYRAIVIALLSLLMLFTEYSNESFNLKSLWKREVPVFTRKSIVNSCIIWIFVLQPQY